MTRQVIDASYLAPIQPSTVTTTDWFTMNIQDAGIRQVARSAYSDGGLTRNEMLQIYAKAEAEDGASGDITTAQINDFMMLLVNLTMLLFV